MQALPGEVNTNLFLGMGKLAPTVAVCVNLNPGAD